MGEGQTEVGTSYAHVEPATLGILERRVGEAGGKLRKGSWDREGREKMEDLERGKISEIQHKSQRTEKGKVRVFERLISGILGKRGDDVMGENIREILKNQEYSQRHSKQLRTLEK